MCATALQLQGVAKKGQEQLDDGNHDGIDNHLRLEGTI